VNADRGFFINNELRTPPISPLGLVWKNNKLGDQLQALAFYDFGMAENADAPSGEPRWYLSSVGGGLRYTINRYLFVRADYGIQLRDSNFEPPSDYGSRAHVSVTASF
jgi:hemolysin activation/secretion protein